MADEKQLAKLKAGVAAWNKSRKPDSQETIDLSGANLRRANLRRAYLRGADLSGTDLRGANLNHADLRGANLSSRFITRIDAEDHKSPGLGLLRADFSFANLAGANLSRAYLRGAQFQETVFGDTKLNEVIGLEACKHRGPSTLDHRTLAESGPLPLAFLRGCGLPESLITYLPSLLNQPVQLYSCFISYSTKDQDFADRLYADLQNKGVRCWFAPHDMAPGKKIHEQIDEAIRLRDKLPLILSEHSMNSEWVKTEIRKARKREVTDNRRMLFPVSLVGFQPLKEWECFDAEIGKDSAVEIREYFIPDFSTWKTNHDAYKQNFDRLVNSLQTHIPS